VRAGPAAAGGAAADLHDDQETKDAELDVEVVCPAVLRLAGYFGAGVAGHHRQLQKLELLKAVGIARRAFRTGT
jgi:hypothetical protein